MTYDDPSRRDIPDPVPEDGARLALAPPRSPFLPSGAGHWNFCTPARPAPLVAADPAWLTFLGFAPSDDSGLDPAWVDYLRR